MVYILLYIHESFSLPCLCLCFSNICNSWPYFKYLSPKAIHIQGFNLIYKSLIVPKAIFAMPLWVSSRSFPSPWFWSAQFYVSQLIFVYCVFCIVLLPCGVLVRLCFVLYCRKGYVASQSIYTDRLAFLTVGAKQVLYLCWSPG